MGLRYEAKRSRLREAKRLREAERRHESHRREAKVECRDGAERCRRHQDKKREVFRGKKHFLGDLTQAFPRELSCAKLLHTSRACSI